MKYGNAGGGPLTNRRLMRSLSTYTGSTGDPGMRRWIPCPDIPTQPVLALGAFVSRATETAPSIVDRGHAIYVTAGRIATAHALRLAGIAQGQKVLMPAYHCMSMVEPVAHVGAQPVFYALREDCSVDLDDVAGKIDTETRALVAVNYFGFPQDLTAIRRFCDSHGLVFIEDCAHSFFGSWQGQPLGSFGDFAIGSLTKFFPVRDGGCLVINKTHDQLRNVPLRSQGLGTNVVAVVDTFEDAITHGRLRPLASAVRFTNRLKQFIRTVAPRTSLGTGDNPAQMRSGQQGEFDPDWIEVRATAISRLIVRFASREHIVENRRRNYMRLVKEFSDLKRCRPLFPQLPTGVVPYMFPLWIDHLSDIFATLEDRAIPMQRFGQFPWPTMSHTTCRVARDLSHHSIQLPCHQELRDREITEIVNRVRTLAA